MSLKEDCREEQSNLELKRQPSWTEPMTHHLFLLRHAKSSWDDPGLLDHDRPLSKRGRNAAGLMRQWMASNGVEPDLVFVSTSRRTVETLQALAPWVHPPTVEFS